MSFLRVRGTCPYDTIAAKVRIKTDITKLFLTYLEIWRVSVWKLDAFTLHFPRLRHSCLLVLQTVGVALYAFELASLRQCPYKFYADGI